MRLRIVWNRFCGIFGAVLDFLEFDSRSGTFSINKIDWIYGISGDYLIVSGFMIAHIKCQWRSIWLKKLFWLISWT